MDDVNMTYFYVYKDFTKCCETLHVYMFPSLYENF